MRLRWLPIVVATVLPLPGLVEACLPASVEPALSWRGVAHFRNLADRIADDCPAAILLNPDGSIVPYSFIGTGIMSLHAAGDTDPALASTIRRAVVCAEATHAPDVDLTQPQTFGEHNLYFSHLALLLGIEETVAGSTDDVLHAAIVEHLRAESLADGDFHMNSFPGCCKWPADQSVTLDALSLYDRLHHTSLSERPIRGWLDWMDDGLHVSAVTQSLWYHDLPRGCALSWTTFHMAQFAPTEGRRLYARYQQAFYVDVGGIGGFAEWPDAAWTPMDFDTGPIVFGVGAAATGIGLGSARVYGDSRAWTGILRSSLVFGLPWGVHSRDSLISPLLADAILFHDAAAVPWFAPIAPIGGVPSAPVTPVLFLTADLAGLWVSGRRLLARCGTLPS